MFILNQENQIVGQITKLCNVKLSILGFKGGFLQIRQRYTCTSVQISRLTVESSSWCWRVGNQILKKAVLEMLQL